MNIISLDSGIDLILHLQQMSPGLDAFFRVLTSLGDTGMFILVLPLIFWSIDRRTGSMLAVIFLFSAWLNSLFKVLAEMPRPFEYDARVMKLTHASGGGFPSGHTQGAVVFWGYLASHLKSSWFSALAFIMIIMIPLSRLYLGVHFPVDLLGGYIIGSLVLVTCIPLESRISSIDAGFGMKLTIATVLPFILAIVFPGSDDMAATTGGAILGASAGFVIEREFIRFDSDGSVLQRILRYILGMAVLFVIWRGLKVLFMGIEPVFWLRFLRYSLVGIWATLGAPWCFIRLGLCGEEKKGIT